jgi:hypothetical protein
MRETGQWRVSRSHLRQVKVSRAAALLGAGLILVTAAWVGTYVSPWFVLGLLPWAAWFAWLARDGGRWLERADRGEVALTITDQVILMDRDVAVALRDVRSVRVRRARTGEAVSAQLELSRRHPRLLFSKRLQIPVGRYENPERLAVALEALDGSERV